MRTSTVLALASVLISLAGCQDVYLSDDIDLVLNFNRLRGPSDTLHTPYVRGTRMTIYANSSDGDQDTTGWWLQSSNPAVVRILSQSGGRAECVAVSAGQAEIRVYESAAAGEPLHTAPVEVRKPDRIELYAHGPLLLGRSEAEARVSKPAILNDGTATFLVRYFHGTTALSGNGVLAATSDTSVMLKEETTFLFENQEWLRITPRAPGDHQVRLSADGVSLGVLPVKSVRSSDISYIKLQGQDEAHATDGDWLVVLARALTGGSVDVHGAEYEWALDGAEKSGTGDLFRYRYLAHNPVQLRARHDGLESLVTINASEGYVDSSNEIGCTAAPGLPPQGAPFAPAALLLGASLMLLVRRRR